MRTADQPQCQQGPPWGCATNSTPPTGIKESRPQYPPQCEGAKAAHWLDASSTKGDTWDRGNQIPSMTSDDEDRVQRQGWIDALRVGENPFTPDLLRKLREQ